MIGFLLPQHHVAFTTATESRGDNSLRLGTRSIPLSSLLRLFGNTALSGFAKTAYVCQLGLEPNMRWSGWVMAMLAWALTDGIAGSPLA